ncbi:MAG: MarR family transcriptional regulator [Nocardioides sp.]
MATHPEARTDADAAHAHTAAASTSDIDGDAMRDLLMQLLSEQLRFRHVVQDALGVDYAGLSAMLHLAQVGSDTPTAIAGTLETSTAATSLVLKRLEASGHISRQPHPTDRRKVVVAPVRESLAAAREHSRPVTEGIDELAAALTPEDRATVTAFLDALVTVYRRALINAR